MKPQIAFHFTADTIIKIASESEIFKQCAMERIPELFQPQYKVGDWVYAIGPTKTFRIEKNNVEAVNSYGNLYRYANDKEIESELETEFWKRYKIGNKIECVQSDKQHILTGRETLQYTRSRNVPQELLVLGLDGKFLMYVYESHFIAHTDTWSGLVDYTLQEYKDAVYCLYGCRAGMREGDNEDFYIRIIESFEKRNSLK